MLRDPKIVTEFPFLRHASQKVTGGNKRRCGKCGNKQRKTASDYEGIKTAIGVMANPKKAQLKKMLDANKIRLYYRDHQGRKVKMTF